MCRAAAPAAQLVAFKSFGGIVNLDSIGARHALALAVVAARKVCLCRHTPPCSLAFFSALQPYVAWLAIGGLDGASFHLSCCAFFSALQPTVAQLAIGGLDGVWFHLSCCAFFSALQLYVAWLLFTSMHVMCLHLHLACAYQLASAFTAWSTRPISRQGALPHAAHAETSMQP